jgi:dTDP-4-amino-4,6-dideoxygalactose transaminase
MRVPFVNLQQQYATIKSEIDKAVSDVLQDGIYIKGKCVSAFETSFARELGVPYCISTGNGTDALFAIFSCLDIGPDDEVLTPALSWISTAETISLTGAKPVFVDVDSGDYSIDLVKAKRGLSTKTKALVAVHLYGQPTHLQATQEFCKQHNLLLIEDCAQAHFSKDEDRLAGTIGKAAAFSFYPTKNMGALGDAGCVVTSDASLADKIRRFCNHGGLTKDEHLFEGINSRMDELQAAILAVKLKYIHQWNEQRRQKAMLYMESLQENLQIALPLVRPGAYHTFHQFVIKTQPRDALKKFLISREVETQIHYPVALPFEPAYKYLGHKPTDFPEADKLQHEILSLPIYPELSTESILYVCSCINEFYKHRL